ncbi:16138_t:CDS:2 [Funneliformis mosseae]|uniref:16138_t:CDS:1 n=1 Tax=Funneliformis mosseae TaxID=27381 RepID=A0A9N8UY70_FUNMO|nr:16138_t:CDS:2 [Funneliformis mosseae]
MIKDKLEYSIPEKFMLPIEMYGILFKENLQGIKNLMDWFKPKVSAFPITNSCFVTGKWRNGYSYYQAHNDKHKTSFTSTASKNITDPHTETVDSTVTIYSVLPGIR